MRGGRKGRIDCSRHIGLHIEQACTRISNILSLILNINKLASGLDNLLSVKVGVE